MSVYFQYRHVFFPKYFCSQSGGSVYTPDVEAMHAEGQTPFAVLLGSRLHN